MRLTPVILLAIACGVESPTQNDTQDSWATQNDAVTRAAPGDLDVELEGVLVGSWMEIDVRDAYPYEDFHIVFSLAGAGETCPGFLDGGCLGMNGPLRLAGTWYADEDGRATVRIPVPYLPRFEGSEVCAAGVANRGPGGWGISETTCVLVEADDDRDGLSNTDEDAIGSDRYNPDTDGDGYLDGEDCDPLDAERALECGQLYAAMARGGGTGFYAINTDDASSELVWNNGNSYSSMAWDGDRLVGLTGGFGHSLHELDPADGTIIESYYTGGYYSGMTADDSGDIYYMEGCSLYRISSGDSVSAGSYVGSAPCNGGDIAVNDGDAYYISFGGYGTIGLDGSGYSSVGSFSMSAGPRGGVDRTGGTACNQGECYALNGTWSGGEAELYWVDYTSGDETYIGTMPDDTDCLVFAP